LADSKDKKTLLPATGISGIISDFVRETAGSDTARKVGETFTTRVLLFFLSFVQSIVIARALGAELKGVYALALALGAILTNLCTLGLHSANPYYASKNRKLLAPLAGNSLLVPLVAGAAAISATWMLFRIFPSFAPVSGPLLVLTFIFVPFNLSFLLLQNLLIPVNRVRSFNVINVVNKILTFGLIIAAAYTGFATPQAFLLITVVVIAISAGWSLKSLLPLMEAPLRPSYALFRDSTKYWIKAYLSALLGLVIARMGLFVLNHMMGPAAAGLFSVANGLVISMAILPETVGMIIFPKLCEMETLKQKLIYTRKTAIGMCAILAPAALLLAVLAKPIIVLLFGEPFSGSAAPLIWLLPGFLILSVESLYRKVLTSKGFRKEIVFGWVAAFILNLALNLTLVPKMGISGAAVAYSASLTLVSAVTIFLIGLTGKQEAEKESL